MIRPRRSRVVVAFSIAALALLAGCTPDAVFFGDGVLRAIESGSELESGLRSAGRDAGERLQVRWDPSLELGTAWLENELSETRPLVAVLSPYFSLFASDIAAGHPAVRFVVFGSARTGSRSTGAQITRVGFDRVPAFEQAGRAFSEWLRDGAGRKLAILFHTRSDEQRSELAALTGGMEEELPVAIREYDTVPDRESVRQVLRELLLQGNNGFALHIGTANRFAVDILQSEPVVFGTDGAGVFDVNMDALLYTVEHPLPAAVRAGLEAPQGTNVTVHAEFRTGEGFASPQLVPEPEEPESENG